jgi:hypothetical protein
MCAERTDSEIFGKAQKPEEKGLVQVNFAARRNLADAEQIRYML